MRLRDTGRLFFGGVWAVEVTWAITALERQQNAKRESKYFFIVF
jgi:hypothetical protein